jgi:hypothetical protein
MRDISRHDRDSHDLHSAPTKVLSFNRYTLQLEYQGSHIIPDTLRAEYHEFRSTFGLSYYIFFLIMLIALFLIITRGLLPEVLILEGLYTLVMGIVLWNRLVSMSGQYANLAFWGHYKSKFIYRHRVLFEDLCMLCVAIAGPLVMIARLRRGPCTPGTSWFYQQFCCVECVENVHGVSVEYAMFSVLAPLLHQKCVKGPSVRGLVCAWVTVIVMSNVALSLAGSDMFVHFNCMILVALMVSYGIELGLIENFIQKKLADQSSDRLSRAVQNEKEFINTLTAHFATSGHDLKSPCTAMSIAAEELESIFMKRLMKDGSRYRRRPNESSIEHAIDDSTFTGLCLTEDIMRSTVAMIATINRNIVRGTGHKQNMVL